MSGPVARVSVVFNDHLEAADLRDIVARSPAWVVDSHANLALAEALWPSGRGLEGMLCFFGASPTALADVLTQIEEHMEGVGWDRAENELVLQGCADIAACEALLIAAGFRSVVREPSELVSRRAPIRRPTRDEFDAAWPDDE